MGIDLEPCNKTDCIRFTVRCWGNCISVKDLLKIPCTEENNFKYYEPNQEEYQKQPLGLFFKRLTR